MKSLRRENRLSGSTKQKVKLIVEKWRKEGPSRLTRRRKHGDHD